MDTIETLNRDERDLNDLLGPLDVEEHDDNPLTYINSTYCELDSIPQLVNRQNDTLVALHLHIRSLPAKYDQLRTMLSKLEARHIYLDFSSYYAKHF